ncbi:MAG: DUF3703 domain-containing protein [Bdellovibrionales bacterium]
MRTVTSHHDCPHSHLLGNAQVLLHIVNHDHMPRVALRQRERGLVCRRRLRLVFESMPCMINNVFFSKHTSQTRACQNIVCPDRIGVRIDNMSLTRCRE